MNTDYHETDPSTMATQQAESLEAKEQTNWRARYEQFCEENPWDLECKIFDL